MDIKPKDNKDVVEMSVYRFSNTSRTRLVGIGDEFYVNGKRPANLVGFNQGFTKTGWMQIFGQIWTRIWHYWPGKIKVTITIESLEDEDN